MSRTYGTATAAAFAARRISARGLLWITARDWTTGTSHSIGLWDGDDDLTFTIGGVDRVYYGAGGIVGIDAIVMTAGLNVQMQGVTLSAIQPAAEQAIRGYDIRLAPIEIHRALFDTETGNLLEEPHQMFTGWCDALPLTRSAVGGSFTGKMTIASTARALTRNVVTKRSDAAMRARSSTDAFCQYASVSGTVPYYWGMNGP